MELAVAERAAPFELASIGCLVLVERGLLDAVEKLDLGSVDAEEIGAPRDSLGRQSLPEKGRQVERQRLGLGAHAGAHQLADELVLVVEHARWVGHERVAECVRVRLQLLPKKLRKM